MMMSCPTNITDFTFTIAFYIAYSQYLVCLSQILSSGYKFNGSSHSVERFGEFGVNISS